MEINATIAKSIYSLAIGAMENHTLPMPHRQRGQLLAKKQSNGSMSAAIRMLHWPTSVAGLLDSHALSPAPSNPDRFAVVSSRAHRIVRVISPHCLQLLQRL